MALKILITGGSGLLGVNWALARNTIDHIILGLNERVISPDFADTASLNLSDETSLLRSIQSIAPDVIIHAAALTNVDYCESHPDAAMRINCGHAETVANVARRLDIKLVNISTDHLFDGTQPLVDEHHPCTPVNIYGKSKYDAELAVLNKNPNALNLRINFFCWGPQYRPSFSDWIINSLKQEKEVTLFDNVYFTPLYAGEVINFCHDLLQHNHSGTYHFASSDRISKYRFGLKIAETFNLKKSLIKLGNYNADHGIPRPLDMSLDNSRLRSTLNLETISIGNSINLLKSDQANRDRLQNI